MAGQFFQWEVRQTFIHFVDSEQEDKACMQRPRSSSLPANTRFLPCMPLISKRKPEEEPVDPALSCFASGKTSKTHTNASLTTVVVLGLPRCIDLQGFLGVTESSGFGAAWDFANVPQSTGGENRSYAFLNLKNHTLAVEFMEAMNGHMWHTKKHDEFTPLVFGPSRASWADVQGWEANMAHNGSRSERNRKTKHHRRYSFQNARR